MQESGGFVDPYTLYFDVTVEADATELGHAGLQLDGGSTSLFDQVIIS